MKIQPEKIYVHQSNAIKSSILMRFVNRKTLTATVHPDVATDCFERVLFIARECSSIWAVYLACIREEDAYT